MAKAPKVTQEPVWHPDFRVAEHLPDVKVVRTTFLINFICIVALVSVLGFWFYVESRLGELSSQLAATEDQLQQLRPEQNRATVANRKFDEAAAFANDLNIFANGVYNIPAITAAIAEACPENVFFRSFQADHEIVMNGRNMAGRRLVLTFEGVLQGDNVRDVAQIQTFGETLKELPIFAGKVETLEIPSPTTAGQPFRFNFSVVIRLQPKP